MIQSRKTFEDFGDEISQNYNIHIWILEIRFLYRCVMPFFYQMFTNEIKMKGLNLVPFIFDKLDATLIN